MGEIICAQCLTNVATVNIYEKVTPEDVEAGRTLLPAHFSLEITTDGWRLLGHLCQPCVDTWFSGEKQIEYRVEPIEAKLDG
jgi:hypothetical protein